MKSSGSNSVPEQNKIIDDRTDFRGAEIDSVTIDNLGGTNWDQAQWDEHVLAEIKKKYNRS